MSDGQRFLAETHTVGLNTRQVFRACTFYLVFKEPANSEVTFPSSDRVLAVIRRTHPEYRTSASLSTPFFGIAPGTHCRQKNRPEASNIPRRITAGARCSPLGLGPLGLAGLGCRPPGALKELAASAAPSPGIQAATPLSVVMPVRPARLSRLAGNARGVNP